MMKHKNKSKFLVNLLVAAIFASSATLAFARSQQNRVVIRDTEIEDTISEWMQPIFQAAGVDPNAVHIVLVQNDQLNAFVAGGANIFVYTGLIEKTENPGELIGVLAHEMGHISGGHLIRTRDALERASYESMIGTILGIGAAIASGDSGAVPALTLGSASMAQRRLLAHSRVQESSADQAALSFMEKAKLNPSGLASFMVKLKSEILMPQDQQSEYVLTHPLVEDRIEAMQTRIQASAYKNKPFPAKWTQEHARMKAKLLGFINPGQVAWTYDDRDKSITAQYARAIAAYRNNQVSESLKIIDDLIAQEQDNPYFLELKGQMLVDYGRGSEAIAYYQHAVEILPNAPLLRIAYGHTLIETASEGKKANADLQKAVTQIERALIDEPRSSQAHRLLATAYGRMGQEPLAKIHLAEEAVLQRNFPYAKEQAESVLKSANKSSKEAIMAKDVLSFIEANEKK